MINVLFSARDDLWVKYGPVLTAQFTQQNLDVVLTNKTNAPESVDYLVYAPTCDDDDLSVFSNLKLIQCLWAGPDKLLRNKSLKQPLARMVDPGMTQGMLDYVFGHILRHHLNTDVFINAAPGDWLCEQAPALPSERTVAFLGIGKLGMACAQAVHNYGFNVLGWSRTQKTGMPFACFTGPEGLKDVLGKSDIIVTLMPYTPATENIIDAAAIAAMKNGAALINPGRGELIDDDALLAGLNSAKLSGATLDVFRFEPLHATHPFWTHPDVTVTPHVASQTRVATASAVVAQNIARVERGEKALYLVDRNLKY